ncbi:MAG: dipeptide/oligopeptide/nickel ABC transporter ATP-binding protein [Bryobacteraceae bacterium]
MMTDRSTLVEVRSVTKSFTRGRWYSAQRVLALDSVTLSIHCGSTVALVGASGSGKSTLARCIAQMEKPDGGEIWFDGRNLTALAPSACRRFRTRIQLVPQNVAASLNPRWTAAQIVSEPLCVQRWGRANDRLRRSLELIESVGLDSSTLQQNSSHLSGGQRTRLALARALALEPRLLILDESLASLDLLLQAQIINLLIDLQARHSLAYLVIAHDMTLVAAMTDKVVELQQGKIVRQDVYTC